MATTAVHDAVVHAACRHFSTAQMEEYVKKRKELDTAACARAVKTEAAAAAKAAAAAAEEEAKAAVEAHAAAAALLVVPREVEAPTAALLVVPRGDVYTLVSDEEIERRTQLIDSLQLKSDDSKSVWTEKHHPKREAAKIIDILKNREGRSASKEQLLAALPGWTLKYTRGNPLILKFFLKQLELQGFIRK